MIINALSMRARAHTHTHRETYTFLKGTRIKIIIMLFHIENSSLKSFPTTHRLRHRSVSKVRSMDRKLRRRSVDHRLLR